MQMSTAIIENPNFFNIWKTMHDNIMKMVSTHIMFKVLQCNNVYNIQYVYANLMRAAIIEKPNFFNIWNIMHDETGIYINIMCF